MPKDFSPKHLISISTLISISDEAGLRAISEGTCYYRTRLTFHSYSQVTRRLYTDDCGPPCGFRHISSCPGIDRPVSGSFQVIKRAINTLSLMTSIAKTCFRFGSMLKKHLTSPLKNTPCLVFQNENYNYVISGSFHSLLQVLFCFPSPYLFAIGL